LQVGSVLLDSKGQVIAEYFFRDIEINPTFDKDQFTRKAL
jgi:outer membrane lipoprotein-sorting protein